LSPPTTAAKTGRSPRPLIVAATSAIVAFAGMSSVIASIVSCVADALWVQAYVFCAEPASCVTLTE
jgi:hypothetical protein